MTTIIKNKKAYFDYEILDTYEAGLVLSGHEVKAIRAGKAKLDGAYVIIRGGEAYLVNASVSAYQPANTPPDYDPERPRKLLFSKKELARLERESATAGLTLVPIKLYNSGRNLKLEVGVGRGKKKVDKRETIKKRDTERELRRSLKY